MGVKLMSVDDLSVVYNLIFIGILITVCGLFSLIHLWIKDLINLSYWIQTTLLFTAICFITIFIWYFTIGFIH